MPWLRFTLLIILATILQSSFIGDNPHVTAPARPDLLLILLVFFAVRSGPQEAVLASFAIGFAADLIHPATGFMGPQIISFGLFGTLLSNLSNVISIRRVPFQMVTIFLMGIVTSIGSYLLGLLRAESAGFNLGAVLFWRPLLSGLIGPFLFPPVAWWMKMTKRRRRRIKSSRR